MNPIELCLGLPHTSRTTHTWSYEGIFVIWNQISWTPEKIAIPDVSEISRVQLCLQKYPICKQIIHRTIWIRSYPLLSFCWIIIPGTLRFSLYSQKFPRLNFFLVRSVNMHRHFPKWGGRCCCDRSGLTSRHGRFGFEFYPNSYKSKLSIVHPLPRWTARLTRLLYVHDGIILFLAMRLSVKTL